MAGRTRYPWHTVDWTKSTDQIAADLGALPTSVSKARRRYAPHTLGAYAGRPAATKAPKRPATYNALRQGIRVLNTSLAQHQAALRDANLRITQLHEDLEDARARAHRYEHELDRLRRRPPQHTPTPAPTPPPPPPPPPSPTPAPAARMTRHTRTLLLQALDEHPDLIDMLGPAKAATDYDLDPSGADLNFRNDPQPRGTSREGASVGRA